MTTSTVRIFLLQYKKIHYIHHIFQPLTKSHHPIILDEVLQNAKAVSYHRRSYRGCDAHEGCAKLRKMLSHETELRC